MESVFKCNCKLLRFLKHILKRRLKLESDMKTMFLWMLFFLFQRKIVRWICSRQSRSQCTTPVPVCVQEGPSPMPLLTIWKRLSVPDLSHGLAFPFHLRASCLLFSVYAPVTFFLMKSSHSSSSSQMLSHSPILKRLSLLLAEISHRKYVLRRVLLFYVNSWSLS